MATYPMERSLSEQRLFMPIMLSCYHEAAFRAFITAALRSIDIHTDLD